jgi:hypothetical protein
VIPNFDRVIQAAQTFDVDGQLSTSPPLDCRAAGAPSRHCARQKTIRTNVTLAARAARNSMSNKPTRTAVAGRFQSKTGEDLIQFVDADGSVVVWIDCNGVLTSIHRR